MRPEVQFWDKMLPDQPEHAHLYKGHAFMRDLFEVVCRSSGIRNPHDEFKLEQSDLFTVEEMASNPIAMRFLQFVIRLAGVRRVLEIGAFIGLSTMYFAKALPADGEVVSIEKFDKFATIARRNFELNGLGRQDQAVRGRCVRGHRPVAARPAVRSRLHRRQQRALQGLRGQDRAAVGARTAS